MPETQAMSELGAFRVLSLTTYPIFQAGKRGPENWATCSVSHRVRENRSLKSDSFIHSFKFTEYLPIKHQAGFQVLGVQRQVGPVAALLEPAL